MSQSQPQTAIYERLVRAASPCEFAEPWDRLRPDAAGFRGLADASTLVSELQREFSHAALQQSGVISSGQGGTPELIPELIGPNNAFLAVRAEESDAVLGLITSNGCIGRGQLAATAILRDAFTKHLLQLRRRPLCIASTVRDVLLLRSLGLPATLAAGLEHLGRSGLRTFCRVFDIGTAPKNYLVAAQNTWDVLLVGWSPCDLSSDPLGAFTAVADHFRNLHRHLGLELRRMRIWRPSSTDLDRLRFRIQYGSSSDLAESVVRSIEESSEPLVPPVSRRPQNVAQAQLQLQELQRGFIDRNQALSNFQDCFERDIVERTVRQAIATDDPQRRAFHLLSAELQRYMGSCIAELSERLTERARTARRRGRESHADPELQALTREMSQLMRTLDQISRLE